MSMSAWIVCRRRPRPRQIDQQNGLITKTKNGNYLYLNYIYMPQVNSIGFSCLPAHCCCYLLLSPCHWIAGTYYMYLHRRRLPRATRAYVYVLCCKLIHGGSFASVVRQSASRHVVNVLHCHLK